MDISSVKSCNIHKSESSDEMEVAGLAEPYPAEPLAHSSNDENSEEDLDGSEREEAVNECFVLLTVIWPRE